MAKTEGIFTEEQLRQLTDEDEWYESESEVDSDWSEPVESSPHHEGQPGVKVNYVASLVRS